MAALPPATIAPAAPITARRVRMGLLRLLRSGILVEYADASGIRRSRSWSDELPVYAESENPLIGCRSSELMRTSNEVQLHAVLASTARMTGASLSGDLSSNAVSVCCERLNRLSR